MNLITMRPNLLRPICSSYIFAERFNGKSIESTTQYIAKRYLQDFPEKTIDNRSHKDHVIILPENPNVNPKDNPLLSLTSVPLTDINFNKVDIESAFKGLSQAILDFEGFLADVDNVPQPYKTLPDMFRDFEKHLYPLDAAFNLFMISIVIDYNKFQLKEIGDVITRYHDLKERRFVSAAIIMKSLDLNDIDLDDSDKRLLYYYKSNSIYSSGRRPLDEGSLAMYKKNLKEDQERFRMGLIQANNLVSYTVDDPDILSSLALEYDDCDDLHHKSRTPLKITVATYKKFMRACPDRFVRRMLWETYNKRCSPKALPKLNNKSLQMNMRITRRKIAELYGYRSHLDFRLKNTMAQSTGNVLECLNSINLDNKPKMIERLQELSDYAYDNKFEDPDGLGLQEYDISYWSHRYIYDILIGMKKHQIKEFFPINSVMNGLREFYRKYFLIDMTKVEIDTDKFWSPKVQLYQLNHNDHTLGNILFDPQPRGSRYMTKCIHAKMLNRLPGSDNVPTQLIGVPYRQASSSGNAYLNVDDVLTLFQIFNNVIERHLFNYKYYELNTYGTLEYDTHNILSNLVYAHLLRDHRILQSMSNRVGQDKPMDSELASRITKSLSYFQPLAIWRELYKAHLDLELNTNMSETKKIAEEIYKLYSPFVRSAENYDFCAMSDIFVGPYDGIKYVDLWGRQLSDSCMKRLENSDGHLEESTMKDFYGKFIETYLDPKSIAVGSHLVSLFQPRLEFPKSSLSVL